MKIQQHYHHDSPFRFDLTVESKDLITHSTMTDLKDHQREMIKRELHKVGRIVEQLCVALREEK